MNKHYKLPNQIKTDESAKSEHYLPFIETMKSYKAYLRSIYFNPKHPASFCGADKLYKHVKREGKYDISKENIESFLEEYDTYTLFRQPKKPSRNRQSKILVTDINEQWEMDLADMQNLSKQNRGYKFILIVIDVFRRFLWTKPLKTKQGVEVSKALDMIISSGGKIDRIRCDAGREFRNASVSSVLKKHGIFHFLAHGDGKAAFAERVILTIKKRLFRYFTYNNTHNWVDVLKSLTKSYNDSVHSSTGFSPASITPSNKNQVWANQYLIPAIRKWKNALPQQKLIRHPKFKYKVGDTVRVSYSKTVFQRGYDHKFSTEYFRVDSRYRRDGQPIYQLNDLGGDRIDGSFYQHELQKVIIPKNKLYEVEKIIKTKGRGKNKKVLVKFKHWPTKFAQWMAEKDVKHLTH